MKVARSCLSCYKATKLWTIHAHDQLANIPAVALFYIPQCITAPLTLDLLLINLMYIILYIQPLFGEGKPFSSCKDHLCFRVQLAQCYIGRGSTKAVQNLFFIVSSLVLPFSGVNRWLKELFCPECFVLS